MEKNGNNQNPMQEAMKIAATPAGQELIKLLQQNGGDELRQAMAKASAGDYTQAKQAITSLLNSPEAKKLLEQLGR